MSSDGAIEMQHRHKSAEVSLQGREGSSEDEPVTENHTASPKVHPRQLDVSIIEEPQCSQSEANSRTEIHQFPTYCCLQHKHSMLMGSISGIIYGGIAQWRAGM